jgi:stage V sporulation protein AD
MTIHYNNVYLKDTATICGPYEREGPLIRYIDKAYEDLYFGEKSFEKAEIKSVRECLNLLIKKIGNVNSIDLVIGGDLLNQITASTYGTLGISEGFIGVYGACSSSVLSMIIASNFIEGGFCNNSLCVVSSHNMTSEKQFRYPTEYGAPRPNSATFTATGAASCFLTNEKTHIKVDCSTLGKIIDFNQNDANDMGRVMAPSAIDTILRHFEDTGRTPLDYDMIITGDLGKYGSEIVKDYLLNYYDVDLGERYMDAGVMLYDLEKQKEVKAGGSGPVCSALVVYSYIYYLLKHKKVRRVLILATGALFSPLLLYQKENINSICHAISLEVI